MKKRGKVLRDPAQGLGLLIIEGQQYWFRPEVVSNSELAAKPGLVVDVTLDLAGQILAITECRLAEDTGTYPVDAAKRAGVKFLRKIAAKCGMTNISRG